MGSQRAQGKDGHSVNYTNSTTDIIITRSIVTGISIIRSRPADQQEHLIVEKNR
ncbi:MAG TPA: hypothetical protein VF773_00350 [Verrucomicrobiae bacterium]